MQNISRLLFILSGLALLWVTSLLTYNLILENFSANLNSQMHGYFGVNQYGSYLSPAIAAFLFAFGLKKYPTKSFLRKSVLAFSLFFLAACLNVMFTATWWLISAYQAQAAILWLTPARLVYNYFPGDWWPYASTIFLTGFLVLFSLWRLMGGIPKGKILIEFFLIGSFIVFIYEATDWLYTVTVWNSGPCCFYIHMTDIHGIAWLTNELAFVLSLVVLIPSFLGRFFFEVLRAF